MCYAIPGKVEAIKDKIVIVDYFGEKKKAINELTDLSVGEYVYAQGGYVINKVLEKEAKEILAVWRDMFTELEEIDLEHSRLNYSKEINNPRLRAILDKACEEKKLAWEELRYLAGLKTQEELELLCRSANFLRQKYHKNACCVHGIIEISNYCDSVCSYCGISAHNQKISRYKMTKDEILEAVGEAVNKYDFKALVLQSGEGAYSIDELSDIITAIKARYAVLVLISFGEIGESGLEKLFQAGARGLLMRFETSNHELYRSMHPGHELDDRVNEIRLAYDMGYLIITGALIGTPGQTTDDILNDIYLTDELNAEMFSFGPFLSHPNTPLAAYQKPGEDDVLKVLALARCMARKDAKILVTTAFETLSPDARKKGLLAGANSLMVNVTPLKYRPLYSIYPGRAHEKDTLSLQVDETVALLRSIGRVPMDIGI